MAHPLACSEALESVAMAYLEKAGVFGFGNSALNKNSSALDSDIVAEKEEIHVNEEGRSSVEEIIIDLDDEL